MLSLRYKAQPVNAVYCENRGEHTDTQWAECNFVMLQQVVQVVTTVLQRVQTK
jgi:hypothetical protein